MSGAEIEKKLQEQITKFNNEIFIYDLLLVYNVPTAKIIRLQKGTTNLFKKEGWVSLKKKLLFKRK
jgi:hypothetical protein|tara:strand:+ start:9626 stop:9823 length:198 start_codon:yes stop_codon:yes gene_type:complete